MRRFLEAAALVAIAIAAGSLTAWWRTRENPVTNLDDTGPRQDLSVEKELRELRARMQRMEGAARVQPRLPDPSRTAQRPTRNTRKSADAGTHNLTVEDDPQLIAEQDRVLEEAKHGRMAEGMRQGRADPARAQEARSTLETSLADPRFTSFQLGDVTCVEKLCRFTIAHKKGLNLDTYIELLDGPPFDGSLFYRYFDDRKESVVYLAKRGEQLPGEHQ